MEVGEPKTSKGGAALDFSNQSPFPRDPRRNILELPTQNDTGVYYGEERSSSFTMPRLFIVSEPSVGYTCTMDHCRDND